MFEPFHPILVGPANGFARFQYIRPENRDKRFYDMAQAVFTGHFQHKRVDQYNRNYLFKGLLIKDIFANLFIKWVDIQFPAIRKVLILRHPCAVAVSKEKLKHWPWVTDPKDFLSQKNLHEDFLHPFENIIENTRSYFERQILIWAIIHYVPLKQLSKGQIHLIFYEELCTDPETEIRHLFSYLGDNQKEDFLDPRVLEQFRTPSQLSLKQSAINNNQNLINGWQNDVTNIQIFKAVQILNAFGLDQIYDHNLMPNRAAAVAMLESTH